MGAVDCQVVTNDVTLNSGVDKFRPVFCPSTKTSRKKILINSQVRGGGEAG